MQDLFKKSVLDNIPEVAVDPLATTIALLIAFALGLWVFVIYKRTYNGVLYSRNFSLSLILLALVSTMIMKTVTSNIALSLGMVGALSIVRFRTAVKDPMDTVYMFWAVAIGITLGGGLYWMAIIGSLIIGLLLYIMFIAGSKGSYAYLLIVRHDFESTNQVNYALRRLPKGTRLKSKTVSASGVEVTMEVCLPGDNTNVVNELLKIEGVFDATLVSYQGDYAA